MTQALAGSHAVSVLEAASQETQTWQEWIDRLAEAAALLLPSPLGNCAVLTEVREHGGKMLHATRGPSINDDVLAFSQPMMADPSLFDPFFIDAPHVCTLDDVRPNLAARGLSQFRALLEMMQAADVVGLCARSDAGLALAISTIRPERVSVSAQVRMALSRIALHVEAGLRLRFDPTSLVAVLRPDGRLVHAARAAQAPALRRQLSAHATSIDRARLRRRRVHLDAIDSWSALAAGEFGFVERCGVQREYLVFANSPRSARARCWTPAEARAVELSSLGMPGKLIAYALGVSSGEVSRLLGRAAIKAGSANRTELVTLASTLRRRDAGPGSSPASIHLSASEREVLALLRRGLSNEEIGERRGTSVRTIANQVAALLRKTGLPSRRALAALMDVPPLES